MTTFIPVPEVKQPFIGQIGNVEFTDKISFTIASDVLRMVNLSLQETKADTPAVNFVSILHKLNRLDELPKICEMIALVAKNQTPTNLDDLAMIDEFWSVFLNAFFFGDNSTFLTHYWSAFNLYNDNTPSSDEIIMILIDDFGSDSEVVELAETISEILARHN